MQALRSPGHPHGPSPWCHQRGRTWAGTCGCSQERLLCTPRRVPLKFSWIFPDTCLYMGRPTCPQPGLPLPRSAQHAPASGHPQAIPCWWPHCLRVFAHVSSHRPFLTPSPGQRRHLAAAPTCVEPRRPVPLCSRLHVHFPTKRQAPRARAGMAHTSTVPRAMPAFCASDSCGHQ